MRLVFDARTASLAALIDYAGVLPPASLDMEAAVAAYRKARSSSASWVAGRFLCQSSGLEELAQVLVQSITLRESPWEIGVIFDGEPGASASRTQSFHAEMQPAAIVAAGEARIEEPSDHSLGGLVDAIVSIQPEIVPFIQLDPAQDLADRIAAIARVLKARGRVGGVTLRCEGRTPSALPDSFDMSAFIIEATGAKLPFRVSGDFRQPVRYFDPDLGVWRHGFINVLLAAGAAAVGHTRQDITDIVEETDASAFSIGVAAASWRELSIPGAAMRRMRTAGFVGYSSSDFTTPIRALADLSFLGQGT